MAKRKSNPKTNRIPSRASVTRSPETATPRDPASFLPALVDIKHRLDVILCILAVAAKALEHQAADIDLDVCQILRRSAIEPLSTQIDELEKIVNRLKTDTR